MKRAVSGFLLLITAVMLALVGPAAASTAFADNGVIHGYSIQR
jgi:hypothetical protein